MVWCERSFLARVLSRLQAGAPVHGREQQLDALVGSEFAQPLTAMGRPCFESDQLGKMATVLIETP